MFNFVSVYRVCHVCAERPCMYLASHDTQTFGIQRSVAVFSYTQPVVHYHIYWFSCQPCRVAVDNGLNQIQVAPAGLHSQRNYQKVILDHTHESQREAK